jgi:stage III sporulation protein AG
MEIKVFLHKLKEVLIKHKYAFIILLIGVSFLLIPESKVDKAQQPIENISETNYLSSETLSEILQTVEGAGQVRVLLSVASGEEILYQADQDVSVSKDNNTTITETVILVDTNRVESGLIKQINPPKYLGAVIVCQGADSPTVKLAITQAVSRIVGLSSDKICVLKMK